MRKIDEYINNAAQCRQLAATASNNEHRRMLLDMAETWERLARERPEQVAQQERVFGGPDKVNDK